MKRAGKIVVWLVGIYLAVMLITGVAIKVVLTGSAVPGVLSTIGAEMPVPIEIGDGDFDLVNWFLFRPSITIDRLSVGNPPGYSSTPMLETQGLSAQFSLASLFGDEILIRSFAIRAPVLTIEANRGGVTNFEALLFLAPDAGSPEAEAQPEDGKTVAVDQLLIESGTLRYTGPGMPNQAVEDVNITLSNFSKSRACDIHLDANLFSSDNSQLVFDGRGGPYSKSSLPAEGSLSIVLAPAEMPSEIRDEYFGNFFANPGEASRVTLETAMKGDVLGAFRGDGKLAFSDLMIGRDGDHQLAFEGEAPLRLDSQKLLANPSVQLLVNDASLKLGDGQWKGKVLLGYTASRMAAGSSGSISGVRINQLLGAFTTAGDALHGIAEIPHYNLSGNGKNAEELRNSLTGKGRIEIKEGRVSLFDLVATIERHAKKILTGEGHSEGETKFLSLTSSVEIGGQRITLPDALLQSTSTTVQGQGYITFDQELHLDLTAAIRGQVARLVGGSPDDTGTPVAGIPVTVRGTVESPKVRPNITGIVVKKALGFLDSLLKGKQSEKEETEAQTDPQQ